MIAMDPLIIIQMKMGAVKNLKGRGFQCDDPLPWTSRQRTGDPGDHSQCKQHHFTTSITTIILQVPWCLSPPTPSMLWTCRCLGSQPWWTCLVLAGATGSNSASTTSAAWSPQCRVLSPSGHLTMASLNLKLLDLQVPRNPPGKRVWSLPSCLCSGW